MYRLSAATISAVTVRPSVAAFSCAASHRSSGIRRERSGVLATVGSGDLRGASLEVLTGQETLDACGLDHVLTACGQWTRPT